MTSFLPGMAFSFITSTWFICWYLDTIPRKDLHLFPYDELVYDYFQQDDATAHTSGAAMDFLVEFF